jgi:flagellin-specific chaperone FliS
MNDQDKQKVKLAIANSFLQSATVHQALAILQEKALSRADEEMEAMDDKAMKEILTNIRAQEIANELKNQGEDKENSTDEQTPAQEDQELTAEAS